VSQSLGYNSHCPIKMATTEEIIESIARRLSEGGYKVSREVTLPAGAVANRLPLLRGMQFGYMIIPIIAGTDPDSALVQHVSALPKRHWSLFEYPVGLTQLPDVPFSRHSDLGCFFLFGYAAVCREIHYE
jgi:hypothetical protein